MLGFGHRHHEIKFHPHARPFDEFLIGNPTGNPDFVISSSGNYSYPAQHHQLYTYQSNISPGTLFQNQQPTTIPPHTTVLSR